MYGNSMSYKASQLYQSNEKLLQNMLKGIVMLTTTTDQTALWRRDVNSLLKTAPPRHGSLCKYCLLSPPASLDGSLLPSELTFLPKTVNIIALESVCVQLSSFNLQIGYNK